MRNTRLHCENTKRTDTRPLFSFCLQNSSPQPVAPAAGYSWTEGARCYQENIYDLSYDALADCTLSLDTSVYQTAIHGDWRVTFRLEDE